MSTSCGFFNSLNGDRKYNASHFGKCFEGIIRDGILASVGNCFVVKANSGMTVTVGSGKSWYLASWLVNDADLPMTLDASDVVLDRIDAIVMEFDTTEIVRWNDLKIIKGESSSIPVRPKLKNTNAIKQIPVAYIDIKANTTSITQADITNMVGTGDCPFVTGILETIDTDDLISKWEAQWDCFYAQQTYEMELAASDWKKRWDEWIDNETANATSEMQNWIATRQAEFDTWFASLQDILSGDVSANLASRILTLEEKFGILATEFCVYHNLLDSSNDVLLDSNGNNIESRIIYVTK